MTAQVAPARGEEGVAGTPAWPAQVGVVLAALAASVGFYRTLLFGGDLHGYDWQSHHFHYFDWVRTSLVEHHTLPLYMFHAWITPNFLANAEGPQLGPLVWLLFALPTDSYLKLLLVLFSATGFAGTFALLRDLRVGAPVAAFAAVVFAFGGFFVAHLSVGHPWAMGAFLLPLLLWLYRRAALGSQPALFAAAFLGAAVLLGGQHQPFVWQNLFIAAFASLWALRVRALFPLRRAALLVLATAGLAGVKLLPMLAEFADYAPTQRTGGFALAALPGALAAGGRGPETAVAGLDYAHGSGWWEWSFYLGPLACAWLVVGVAAARRCWTLVAVGAGFLLLALEGPAWALLEDLPVWRTQRSPSRLLLLALFPFGIAAALGWQRIYEWASERRPRLALGMAVAATLVVWVDLAQQSRPWQEAAVGARLAQRDHRPRPLVVRGPGGARAELVGFAPNRFVYRVRSPGDATIVLPLRHREGSDGWSSPGVRVLSRDGKLAIEVPSGERDVVVSYRPEYASAGLALSAVTLAGLALASFRGSGAGSG